MNVSLFDRVEKALRKLVIVFLSILIAAQLLMQIDSVRHFLSPVDKYEGEPYVNSVMTQDEHGK